MRPVNSMIEFKQIIGRGTWLLEGKAYFTIYDFVRAFEHFNDPEWDGEPIAPEPPTGPRPPTGGPKEPPIGDPPVPPPQTTKLRIRSRSSAASSTQCAQSVPQRLMRAG